MITLSVRQPTHFNYWLIAIFFGYFSLLSWGLHLFKLTESAHSITQFQKEILSVYQVAFSRPQQQTTMLEPLVENQPQESPIVLPMSEMGKWIEVKKKTLSPIEKPKPQKAIIEKKEVKKKVIEKPTPIKKEIAESKIAQTTSSASPENLSPNLSSSQAGRSQALSEKGIGQGESENEYISALRREIEKYKRYPTQAKRMRQEGNVVMRFILTPEGKISDISVERSSSIPSLDNAAIAALKRVKPIGPKPSNLQNPLIVTLNFELHE